MLDGIKTHGDKKNGWEVQGLIPEAGPGRGELGRILEKGDWLERLFIINPYLHSSKIIQRSIQHEHCPLLNLPNTDLHTTDEKLGNSNSGR